MAFLHKKVRADREEKDDRPIGAGLSRNIGSPTAPGEAVEHELDAGISRCDKQRRQTEGERAEEESWKVSERRYAAARRAANRSAWYASHTEQAERYRAAGEAS